MSDQDQEAKIALSKKNYETAAAISDSIKRAGIKIDDLSVAFAGDTAYLSGITTSEAEIEAAAALARKQPGVENVGSGILVITQEQYQEWLQSTGDEA